MVTTRPGRLEVLLVRHAEPVQPGTPGYAEDDRPLTKAGLEAAIALAPELDDLDITAIYSSPYRRAIQTVEPIAQRRGLRIETIDDLRERRLALELHDEWLESLARSWTDHDFALPGAESSRQAQVRGLAVLDDLRHRHPERATLVIGNHGNLISLILTAFEPSIGFDFHLAMPMPAVYRLTNDGSRWQVSTEALLPRPRV